MTTQISNRFSFFIKKVKYEVSLQYTKITPGSWWNKVGPYNIYLGAIPLKNKGHLDQLKKFRHTKSDHSFRGLRITKRID